MIQYSLQDPSNPASDLDIDTHTGAPLLDLENPNSELGLIGNFLQYTVEQSENLYNFKKGNNKTYAGNRGEALQDQDSFLAGQDVPGGTPFVPQGTNLDYLMDSYSNSGYFNDPLNPGDELEEVIIDKVSGDIPANAGPSGRNSNELLNRIEDEDDYIVGHTVRALQRYNRFNMNNIFPDEDVSIDENRYEFVRDERKFDSSFEDLKNAAASQLLKASGYMINVGPSELSVPEQIERLIRDDIEGPDNESKVIMPSNVEGLEVPKIEVEKLLGMNSTGVPKDGISSVRAGTGVNIPYEEDASNSSSYGVIYNQSIRFGDFTNTHKVKTALRMITMYKLIKAVYEEIISELVKEDIEIIKDDLIKIAASPVTTNSGKLALGLCRKSNKFISNNYLFNNFLTPTDFSYSDCFFRGIEVIFGSNINSTNSVSKNLTNIYDSPGFWLALSNSVIKKTFKFKDFINQLGASSSGEGQKEAIRSILNEFGDIAKIANIIAIIGEKSLHHTNGSTSVEDITKKVSNVRDVDQLDNIPGNRVGKSRRKASDNPEEIGSETTLFWEQSSVPSAYILPLNIIRAASDLNNTYTRTNPARGMLGSRLVKNTYTGLDTDGSGARIPNTIVKILEDKLDSEYVPFYIQDLRTNEIISFHAFLSQLTDTIQPQYSSTQGYGRLDPVQTYQSTTRSINVGFTLYATNREDFDDMWYKINKFVTLLYPQWTQGTIVQTGDPDSKNLSFFSGFSGSRFVQPFTQTIGASPIVRLRVGDVIKSNYSRFNLARTFGIGDQGVKANPIGNENGNLLTLSNSEWMRSARDIGLTIFGALAGSPQGLLISAGEAGAGAVDSLVLKAGINSAVETGAALLAEVLINGFVNPLISIETLRKLKDPNISDFGRTSGLSGITYVYINPNMIDGYQSIDGERFFTSKRVLGIVQRHAQDELNEGKVYRVKVFDPSNSDINKKELLVKHQDIWNDPSETFIKSVAGITYAIAGFDAVGLTDSLLGAIAKKGGLGGLAADFGADVAALLLENPESAFMRPEINPFTRAFHSTRGRGLAGVIKGITFNWLEDFNWETDHNARAPIGCQISFTFDVIHDIPPGLDHTGFNRAPLYNVGEIMRNVAGDVYDDRFSRSERKFREGGKSVILPGKTTNRTGKK
jgi:hypothetical protein